MMMKTASKTYFRILPAIGLALILIGYFYYTFELIEAKKELDHIERTKLNLNNELKDLENQRIIAINTLKQYDSLKTLQQQIINSSNDAKTVQAGKALITMVSNKTAQLSAPVDANNKNLTLAEEMEKQGFTYLLNKDLNNAVSSFKSSENAFNGYHVVYEIALYLERNSIAVAQNPDNWKVIYKKLLKDYSWNMPAEIKSKLQAMTK
jgi:hypothetical protein